MLMRILKFLEFRIKSMNACEEKKLPRTFSSFMNGPSFKYMLSHEFMCQYIERNFDDNVNNKNDLPRRFR